MDKFAEFFNKITADETATAEFAAVLNGRDVNDLSDDELQEVSKIGEKLGVLITADELKMNFAKLGGELSDEVLEKCVGGMNTAVYQAYAEYLSKTDIGTQVSPQAYAEYIRRCAELNLPGIISEGYAAAKNN